MWESDEKNALLKSFNSKTNQSNFLHTMDEMKLMTQAYSQWKNYPNAKIILAKIATFTANLSYK